MLNAVPFNISKHMFLYVMMLPENILMAHHYFFMFIYMPLSFVCTVNIQF